MASPPRAQLPHLHPWHPGPHHRPSASTHAHHRQAKPPPLFLRLPIGPNPTPSHSGVDPPTQASDAPELATAPSPSFMPESTFGDSNPCPCHRAASPDLGLTSTFLPGVDDRARDDHFHPLRHEPPPTGSPLSATSHRLPTVRRPSHVCLFRSPTAASDASSTISGKGKLQRHLPQAHD